MTDKEKLKKIKDFADAMYYAAQYLTTDASRLHKAMDEYHQFLIYEYYKEEHEYLEEEIKFCAFSTSRYTDKERKALCKDCEEECRFNKKEEPTIPDIVDEHYWEMLGEKPAEWTAEDENQRINTIGLVKNANDCAGILDKETALNWLNDIKDRFVPQSKQEWSEEDERYYNSLIEYLKYSITNGKPETYISGRLTDFLKSLKDRYTWKPSDSQMIVLNDIIINGHLSNANERILKGLQEQLKKLKG